MPILVALPGLLMAALAASGPLWRRIPFVSSIPALWLDRILPWMRSAGLLYLAVVAGWISMRDAGLMGQSAEEWLAGGIVALILGMTGAWLSNRHAVEMPLAIWLQDEARWTLYRAVVWPLVIFLPIAVPVAFFVSFLEWRLEEILCGKSGNWQAAIPWLVRALGSALLFLVSHNIYIALVMYLLAHQLSIANFKFPFRNS
jgi:hypothetical protein